MYNVNCSATCKCSGILDANKIRKMYCVNLNVLWNCFETVTHIVL